MNSKSQITANHGYLKCIVDNSKQSSNTSYYKPQSQIMRKKEQSKTTNIYLRLKVNTFLFKVDEGLVLDKICDFVMHSLISNSHLALLETGLS